LYKGRPHAPLVESKKELVVVVTTATSPPVISVVVTSSYIVWWISSAYKDGVPAVVERLEYDPNRSANIALLKYADGERRYIIAPKGLKVGDPVQSGDDAPIKVGNTLPLRNMPLGATLHCMELKAGKGAQLARAARTSVQLLGRDGAYAIVRLRSW